MIMNIKIDDNSLHTDIAWNASDSTCQRRHQLHFPWIVGWVWKYDWRGRKRSNGFGNGQSQEKTEVSCNRTSGVNGTRIFVTRILFNMMTKNDVHKRRCQRWAVHFVWYWLQNCEYRCRLNHQFVIRWVRDANKLQGLSLLLPEWSLKTSGM